MLVVVLKSDRVLGARRRVARVPPHAGQRRPMPARLRRPRSTTPRRNRTSRPITLTPEAETRLGIEYSQTAFTSVAPLADGLGRDRSDRRRRRVGFISDGRDASRGRAGNPDRHARSQGTGRLSPPALPRAGARTFDAARARHRIRRHAHRRREGSTGARRTARARQGRSAEERRSGSRGACARRNRRPSGAREAREAEGSAGVRRRRSMAIAAPRDGVLRPSMPRPARPSPAPPCSSR